MLLASKKDFARRQSEQYSVEYITICDGFVLYRSFKGISKIDCFVSVWIYYPPTVSSYARMASAADVPSPLPISASPGSLDSVFGWVLTRWVNLFRSFLQLIFLEDNILN